MDILLFCLMAGLVIVIPGPNVLVIVGTTLQQGRRRGLQTVAGTSTAMLVQLAVAALGTAGFVNLLSNGFVFLKWAGAAYLAWLGINLLLRSASRQGQVTSATGSFQRGFWVSLTNPKTILFFSAFLPQFVVAQQPYLPQIAVLSALFWAMAVLLDSTYALLAAALTGVLRRPGISAYAGKASGMVYLGAAAMLVNSRQP